MTTYTVGDLTTDVVLGDPIIEEDEPDYEGLDEFWNGLGPQGKFVIGIVITILSVLTSFYWLINLIWLE